jgi:hypothetical protein
MILDRQEAQAIDLADQETLYKDKLLKAELQALARKDKQR